MYVSRGLGFQNAEFEMEEAKMTPRAVQRYDAAVGLWQDILTAIPSFPAIEKTQALTPLSLLVASFKPRLACPGSDVLGS